MQRSHQLHTKEAKGSNQEERQPDHQDNLNCNVTCNVNRKVIKKGAFFEQPFIKNL